MQRGFRGNFPTERRQQGNATSHQYIAIQNQSGDSNGSHDSTMTQVPLTYYQEPGAHPQAYQPNGQMMYNQQPTSRGLGQYGQFVGAHDVSSTALDPMSPTFAPTNGIFDDTRQMYPLPIPGASYEQQMGGPFSQQWVGNSHMQNNGTQGYDQSMQGMAGSPYHTSGQYNGNGPYYGDGAVNAGTSQYAPMFNAQENSYQYRGTSASAMAYYNMPSNSGSPVMNNSTTALGAPQFGPPVGGRGGDSQMRAGIGGRGIDHSQGGRVSPDVRRKPQQALRSANRGQTNKDSGRGGQSGLARVRNASDGYTSNLATAPVLTNKPEKSRAAVSNVSSHAPSVQTPSEGAESRGSSPISRTSSGNLSVAQFTHAEGENLSRSSTIREQPRVVDDNKDINMSRIYQQGSAQKIDISLMAPGGITPSMLAPIQENGTNINNGSERRSAGVIGSQFLRQHTTPVRPYEAVAGPSRLAHGSDLILAGAHTSVGTLADPFGPGLSMAMPYNGSSRFTPFPPMSQLLRTITANGTAKPNVETGLAPMNLPFSETCRDAKEDAWGVIKIMNIPYAVNRSEVLAFLGRNARLISESDYEPVHIVMERVTSKTLDCYVEFVSFNEALAAVNRFEQNKTGGRTGRLGSRHVEIELSSQAALMKELFPKAKNVLWHGGNPEIIPWDPNDKYNSGFQGFISKEELVMLVKHVEAPQRSPFSKECPQRPFECLVSTLIKYPWYAVQYITIEDRNLLHEATKSLIEMLVERVEKRRDEVNLTRMLLKRVVRAALRCPGFTPVMKDDISFIASVEDSLARDMGVPPHADQWGLLWTIGPKPGFQADVLLWYIAIIREATQEARPALTLAQRAAKGHEEPEELKLFGNLEKFIRRRKGLLTQTLHEVAQAEWEAIEYVLTQAFTPHTDGRVEG